jgi:integrase
MRSKSLVVTLWAQQVLLMASIRKKNDKWQVQVRRGGFPSVSRTFLSKADAVKWARMVETGVDRRDLPKHHKVLETTSLAQLVSRYMAEIVPLKKSAKVETIILNAFLRHKICKRALCSIEMDDWNSYRDQRLKTISPKSLKRQLSPIRHMFTVAIDEWGIPLNQNPIAKLKLKAEDKKRNRRLRVGEEDRLLEIASKTKPGYLHGVIGTAIETAMRRGEILAIQKGHIDFESQLLEIPETKNGEARTIPLTQKAIGILSNELSAELPDDYRVFHVSLDALRHSWSRACIKAKIIDLHFHDLRHEAISRFFEMGLTTPEVALISGHKDIRMLFRYAHATQKAILGKFQNHSAEP